MDSGGNLMTKARDLANGATALSAVSATELAYLDGVTSAVQTQIDGKQAINAAVSTTELGYLDGVTSAIQTQIDSKIGSASAINPTIVDAKGDIIAATAADTVARLAVGANDTVLTADSSTATGLKWAAAAGGSSTFVGCSLKKTTSQSVPNATYTVLSFNSELYDTNGFHDNTTNNTRITIPSGKGGYYEVAFAIPLSNNTTGDRIYHIYKNGSLISEHGGTPSAVYPVHEGKRNLALVATDYLELYVYQSSGGNRDYDITNTGGFFSVAFLGA
jgi:hypothetical protein